MSLCCPERNILPATYAKAVMAVLQDATSPGVMSHVRDQLPEEYDQLFELVGEPA